MVVEILSRIRTLLVSGTSRFGLSISDYDELQMLHNRVAASFPKEFNKLFATLEYKSIFNTTPTDNTELFRRLIRILDVADTLPHHLRNSSRDGLANSESLTPTFEITAEKKSRIFELCSEMRLAIHSIDEFDAPHRIRLLDRVAAIEAETQKPRGMFDVLLGGIVDVGESLGKFGKSIKPLTDRMGEIAKIARGGTKEYDQLPPPDEVKRLPAPSDDETSI